MVVMQISFLFSSSSIRSSPGMMNVCTKKMEDEKGSLLLSLATEKAVQNSEQRLLRSLKVSQSNIFFLCVIMHNLHA